MPAKGCGFHAVQDPEVDRLDFLPFKLPFEDRIPDKIMVLTGALNPARFRDSDAVFNIGCAVGAVQALPPGAWIAMNGCIWDPHKVRKNREKNRFETRNTA